MVWKASMAPPSLLEFITGLSLSDALCRLSPSFNSARSHYGTRGCLGGPYTVIGWELLSDHARPMSVPQSALRSS